MPGPVLTPAGTAEIDGQFYSMVRTEKARGWRKELVPEPPWTSGAPAMVSSPQITWHLGGFKSRQGIPGTSERGKNSDARFPFRLLPGPDMIGFTALTAGDFPVSFFEALGYLWVVAGRRVYRINPSDDTVTMSKDFGAGVLGIMGLQWEDDVGFVTTDAADQSLWKVSAVGTPDTWTQAGVGVKAYRLAATNDTMFRVSKTGLARKIATGLDPLVELNWADSIQMGDKISVPKGVVAYGNTILIGKADGIFGVDVNGFGIRLIKRIVKSSANGVGMYAFEPYVLIPHSRGLFRYQTGQVESCGLETELLNESGVVGLFNSFASDGQWVYGVMPVGSDVYIMVGREAKSNEPGFGPFVWDTLMYLATAVSYAIHFSTLWNPPRLVFGWNNSVYYSKMTAGLGLPTQFLGSGVERYTSRYNFDDFGPKDFPKFNVAGRNLNGDRYWSVAYSVDGDTYQTLDRDGNVMLVNTNGFKTFFLPTTVFGRELQYRFSYSAAAHGTVAGEIIHFDPFAVPQSRKVPVVTVQLHLAEGIRHRHGTERRSAEEQFGALKLLAEQAGTVTTSGPWGVDVVMSIRDVQLVEMIQDDDKQPEYLVSVILQERETS